MAPSVSLPFAQPVVEGRFLKRYKRFFVDVELDGRVVTAHTPNTGSMTGMLRTGAPVLLTHDPAPHRKLHYTLQAIDIDGSWAGCHTTLPNRIVELALLAGAVSELRGFAAAQREVTVTGHGERSRLDLELHTHPRGRRVFVEVKTVTLKDGAVARFPDAVSERGTKHLELLQALVESGKEAALIFACQRSDVRAVAPAYEIDPVYADALHSAKDAGVLITGLGIDVDKVGLHLRSRLPLRLARR